MAIDTGGVFTKSTNDFSLGYARARTDQSCHYTLGFYEDDSEEGRGHEIRVRVGRPGLHVSYPAGYAFRSEEKRRVSLLKAAFTAPGMFQQGVVRAHLFPLGPKSKKSWECLLAIDFPLTVGSETGGAVERQFGVVVRKGATIVHGSSRKIRVDTRSARSSSRHVSFTEPLVLEPGNYTVTVVLGDAGSNRPYTVNVKVIVPSIPKGDVFLVEPVLGKRANQDVVIQGASIGAKGETSPDEIAKADRIGSEKSFMPLLVQRVEAADPLIALTRACLVKKGGREHSAVVQRDLDFEDGKSAGTLPAGEIAFSGKNKIECQSLLDILPIPSLPPGDYVFKASLKAGEGSASQPRAARFSVAEKPKRSDAPSTPHGSSTDGAAEPPPPPQ